MVIWFAAGLLGAAFYLSALALKPASGNRLMARINAPSALLDSAKEGSFATKFDQLSMWLRQKVTAKRRLDRVNLELPDFIDLLWVAVFSGSGLYAAISHLRGRMNGILAAELDRIVVRLDQGSSLEREITALSQRLPSRQIQEFCHKLLWSFERGTPLVSVLAEQASASRGDMRNQLSRLAGRNETRMLIPLVFLILPVTVLFAIYPSLQLLNLNYI